MSFEPIYLDLKSSCHTNIVREEKGGQNTKKIKNIEYKIENLI